MAQRVARKIMRRTIDGPEAHGLAVGTVDEPSVLGHDDTVLTGEFLVQPQQINGTVGGGGVGLGVEREPVAVGGGGAGGGDAEEKDDQGTGDGHEEIH